MTILFWSSALFLSAFLIQIFLWKIKLPDRQAKTLLIIFSITFIAGITGVMIAPQNLTNFGISSPQHVVEYAHIGVLYWAFTMAYLITYSAVEVDSPSLIMTMTIFKAGEKGLPVEAFNSSMTDEILVTPRVHDLTHDKIAELKTGVYRLTLKGLLLAKIFNSYRTLLSLKDKGG